MKTHRFVPRRMLNGMLTKMCKHCGEFRDHPNHGS
jgi:hypothetical protein